MASQNCITNDPRWGGGCPGTCLLCRGEGAFGFEQGNTSSAMILKSAAGRASPYASAAADCVLRLPRIVRLGRKEKQLISKSFRQASGESTRSETHDSQIVKSFLCVCVSVSGDGDVLSAVSVAFVVLVV